MRLNLLIFTQFCKRNVDFQYLLKKKNVVLCVVDNWYNS